MKRTLLTSLLTTAALAAPMAVPAGAAPLRSFTAMAVPGDPYTTAGWPAVGMDPRNPTEACISHTEHGGLYDRSSNPHQFGRWQISWGLWQEYARHLETWFPGITGRWGTAGPVEQDAVFILIVGDDPNYSNWRPYDGC